MIGARATLLVAGCVVFAGIILAELYGVADDNAPIAAAPPRADDAAVAQQVRPPRLDDLLATNLARPLFSPTRRPPETAEGNNPGAAGFTDKRLTGIVTELDRRLAIFAVTDAKPLIVSEGDILNGWRIENITPTEVSLSGPSGSTILRPKTDPNLVRQPRTPVPVGPGARLPARPGAAPAAPTRSFAPGAAAAPGTAAAPGVAGVPVGAPAAVLPRGPARPGQQ